MTKRLQTEKGFTLVELAIVLVIVGLLIAGILKGQELITNSQITSTIQQIESFGGAVNTFKQNYGAYPGDMSNASTRLIDCAADPCNDGSGDGIIDVNVGAAGATDEESAYFFNHLRAAELVTSFDGTDDVVFGAAYPTASIGGGYLVGDTRNGTTEFDATEMRPGAYLVLAGSAQDDVDGVNGVLTPAQAARIDRTIDDGAPDSGAVIAQNTATTCRVTVGGDDLYDESTGDQTCVIGYRLPR